MKFTIDVKKEQRGIMATQTAAGAKTFAAKETNDCSSGDMPNGGTCDACQ